MSIALAKSFLNKLVLFLLLFFYALFISFNNVAVAVAATTSNLNSSDSHIIEYIRLSVSKQDRNAWMITEEKTWAPWLKEQKGFLGRQLLWDPAKEEAILLITWSSRADWKTIPQSEIDKVQEFFENVAKEITGKESVNPFPIKDQGELFPQ